MSNSPLSSSQQKQDHKVSTSAAVIGSLRRAREYWTPTRSTSAFLSKGVLTPDEFVQAGDELVYRCPTWAWEGGSDDKRKSYLPADKQYLITRGVPCAARVDSVEQSLTLQQGDGDWLVSSLAKDGGDDEEVDDLEDDFDILDINEEGEVVVETKEVPTEAEAPAAAAVEGELTYPEDEEYADMADFEDDNILLDDDAAAATTTTAAAAGGAGGGGAGVTETGDAVVATRRYDVSITYDKYYQTPRVWMTGVTQQGQPLTTPQLMEDVVTDYRHKTVTMEPHPHVAGRQASVHPCQHAKVMKVIVHNLVKASASAPATTTETSTGGTDGGDTEPAVDVTQYLFIFLKFVSSIIPTINYDFTMDVQADTSKK